MVQDMRTRLSTGAGQDANVCLTTVSQYRFLTLGPVGLAASINVGQPVTHEDTCHIDPTKDGKTRGRGKRARPQHEEGPTP